MCLAAGNVKTKKKMYFKPFPLQALRKKGAADGRVTSARRETEMCYPTNTIIEHLKIQFSNS